MGSLIQHWRYAIRTLLGSPVFTLVALLTLTLGIGATSAIFSVINVVLLHPLPYPEPERLVTIWQSKTQDTEIEQPISPHNLFDLRDQTQAFSEVAGFVTWDYNVIGIGSAAERLKGSGVSEGLFRMLGAKAVLGRTFLEEEDEPGKDFVVILSHWLWRERYGSDPGVLGKKLRLEDAEYTIVGVMEPGFEFPGGTKVWKPMGFRNYAGLVPFLRGRQFLRAVGRLKPGVSESAAQAEADLVAGRLAKQFPDFNQDLRITVIPMEQQVVGKIRPALLVLLGAVGLLLLLACANVANLMLVRASVRQGEMSVRTALGANRLQIVRQLLVESLLLALTGGALGLLLAVLGVRLLVKFGPQDIPRLDHIRVDGQVLAFTAVLCILTGLAFGLIPALRLSKPDLAQPLREGGRQGQAGISSRTRRLLVVTEMAVALPLLIGALLFIKSFDRLTHVELGFDPGHVLSTELSLIWANYDAESKTTAFYKEALRRVAALPGVTSAGISCFLPLSGGTNIPHGQLITDFTIEGRPADTQAAAFQPVTPDYFRTLRIPLLKGRFFTDGDAGKSPPVLIINEAMARSFWPHEEPLGKRVVFGAIRGPVGMLPTATWTIVGVVGAVRANSMGSEPAPEMYFPLYQSDWRVATLVVRTAGDPLAIAGPVRDKIASVDKDLALANTRRVEDLVFGSVGRERLITWLLGAFAVVALCLAAVGIYGVVSYSVSQRSHEIGIRIALGAHQRNVVRMVVSEGLVLGLVGVGLGLAGAAALTSVLRSQLAGLLFAVSTRDLETLLLAALALTMLALLASYVPARRAARVDPTVALRHQ